MRDDPLNAAFPLLCGRHHGWGPLSTWSCEGRHFKDGHQTDYSESNSPVNSAAVMIFIIIIIIIIILYQWIHGEPLNTQVYLAHVIQLSSNLEIGSSFPNTDLMLKPHTKAHHTASPSSSMVHLKRKRSLYSDCTLRQCILGWSTLNSRSVLIGWWGMQVCRVGVRGHVVW